MSCINIVEMTSAGSSPLSPGMISGDWRRSHATCLTDDTAEAVLTDGRVTKGKVAPHGDLLNDFPDLGPATQWLKGERRSATLVWSRP
jgi:hypothetical protein